MRRLEILELALLLPFSDPKKPGSKVRVSDGEARASLHVAVLGEDTICPQARAYAEYRVFAALTHIAGTGQVRRARVVLRSIDGEDGCGHVSCTVTVTLDGSDWIRVRTIGAHTYAAINRAVEHITTRAPRVVVDRISP